MRANPCLNEHDAKVYFMDIQNNVRDGTLVSASCLRSRWSWLYGQLWLFPNGLLRLPLPWWTGSAQGYSYRPTVNVSRLESRVFDENVFLQLILNPKNLWIPRDHIVRAYLHNGIWAERLRVELIDGSEVKLFWMRPDHASAPLGKALSGWLGSNLVWE